MSLITKRRKGENGTSTSLVRSAGLTGGKVLYTDSPIELLGHENGPSLSARFNGSGDMIATSGTDKKILLWSLPTHDDENCNFGVLSGHKGAVTAVRWLEDQSTLCSSSADATVGFWDTTTGQRIRKCTGHELCINEVDVSKETGVALSVSDDGWTCLWDQRQRESISSIELSYPLLSGTFNRLGQVFYVAGIDPTVRAFDVRDSSKPLWECAAEGGDSITSLAVNGDDSVLLSRGMNGYINTYSAKEFVPEGIPRANPYVYDGAPSGQEQQLIRAQFSTDNVSIISGSEDKTVTVWDFASRKVTKKLLGHVSTVISIDHHPSENLIVSTSVDGTVIIREF